MQFADCRCTEHAEGRLGFLEHSALFRTGARGNGGWWWCWCWVVVLEVGSGWWVRVGETALERQR